MGLSTRKFYGAKRLSKKIGIELNILLKILDDPKSHYKRKDELKSNGKQRIFYIPERQLKEIQKKIYHQLFKNIEVSSIAHGYVKGMSIATNAEAHSKSKSLIALDIKDAFFKVCFWSSVVPIIELGLDYSVIEVIADLVDYGDFSHSYYAQKALTNKQKKAGIRLPSLGCFLPQGTPTSPSIFNLALREFDNSLLRMANKMDCIVTRYVDNITVSSRQEKIDPTVLQLTRKIMYQFGLPPNNEKFHYIHYGNRQNNPLRICGINIIDGDLYLSRKMIEKTRIQLWNAGKAHDFETFSGIKGLVMQIYHYWPKQLDGIFAKAYYSTGVEQPDF